MLLTGLENYSTFQVQLNTELSHVDNPIKHITLVYNRAHVQFIVLTQKPNPDLRYMSVDFTHGSKKKFHSGGGRFLFVITQLSDPTIRLLSEKITQKF